MKGLAAIFFALLLFPLTSASQVSITTAGPAGAYTQNFNGAFLSSTTYNLTDNAAANLGWYAFRTSGNATPNPFVADNGNSAADEFKNYGAAGNAERALGSLAGPGTDTMYYGLRIQNDTGGMVRSVLVQFTGEQWRAANNNIQALSFSYQVSAGDITSLTAGTWTAFPALNFNSPQATNVGAIDGNAAANRITLAAAIFVDIPAGGEIMIRWSDINDTGNDHGLSIDDLTVGLFVPSAAGVSVGGRAVTPDGTGISGAVIRLSGGALTEPMTAITSPLGYFSFENVPAGATYIIEISSKRYEFAEPTRTITVEDSISDLEFVASPPK